MITLSLIFAVAFYLQHLDREQGEVFKRSLKAALWCSHLGAYINLKKPKHRYESMDWIEQQYSNLERDPGNPRRYRNIYEFFADWCKKFRTTYGLTQAILAELLYVTDVTICSWENPRRPSLPTPANQFRLRNLERELWMKQNWCHGLVELDTPGTIGIKALIASFEDRKAQDQAVYLLEILGPHLPAENRIHLLHITSLTYAVASQQTSENGRRYAEQAFEEARRLDTNRVSPRLLMGIQNELLGYRNNCLKAMPPGKERCEKAGEVIQECLKLFRDSERGGSKVIIFAWNALECACANCPNEETIFPILEILCKHEGKTKVAKRVSNDPLFKTARPHLPRMITPLLKH